MIKSLIPYLILLQICMGLFHAGIGINQYSQFGILDLQYFFILALSLATLGVYSRIRLTPVFRRSWKIIFEHALFIGIIAWFFHAPWGVDWEMFLVFFLSFNTVILLLIIIYESQFGPVVGYGNWGIADFYWRLGSLLTLVNCITLPLIFILTHETLAVLWIFFGVSWVFLWKEELK